jgi:hypothetical protein
MAQVVRDPSVSTSAPRTVPNTWQTIDHTGVTVLSMYPNAPVHTDIVRTGGWTATPEA